MSTPTSPHEALVAQFSRDLRAADPASLAVRLVRAQGQRVNVALEQALTLLTDERPLVIDTLYQSSIENTGLWPSHLAQRLSTARAVCDGPLPISWAWSVPLSTAGTQVLDLPGRPA